MTVFTVRPAGRIQTARRRFPPSVRPPSARARRRRQAPRGNGWSWSIHFGMRRGKNAPTNGGSSRINTPEDTASTRSALKSPNPSPPAVNIPCGQNDRSDAPLLQLSCLDLYCGVTESYRVKRRCAQCLEVYEGTTLDLLDGRPS